MRLLHSLEQHLFPRGRIEIASHGDYFFIATFSVEGATKARVTSQKGARHLSLLLRAELSHHRTKLLSCAEKKYPHPLSPGSITPVDIFLNRAYTIISPVGPFVKICCRRFEVPNVKARPGRPQIEYNPGMYEMHHFGTSIGDVLREMVEAPSFMRVDEETKLTKKEVLQLLSL